MRANTHARPRWLFALSGIACVFLASAANAQPPFDGHEFQINSYTLFDQYKPVVAGRPEGDFVVVWQSYRQLGVPAGSDLLAQRFDTDGLPAGTEFVVNAYTTGSQYDAGLRVGTNGEFLVVWTDEGRDGDDAGIFAQRFDASGSRVGAEARVNASAAGRQRSPSVSFDDGGGAVVVWWTEPTGSNPVVDGSGSAVFARRFDPSGAALGTEFRVNSYTTGDQSFPDVVHEAAGGFVVVWHGPATGDTTTEIRGRRFDTAGAPLGDEFRVTQPYADRYARVVADPSGGFLVVWDNVGSPDGADGSQAAVLGLRFDAAGAPSGSTFQVNTYTTDAQQRPVVATDAAGEFVVAWESILQLSETRDVIARRFRPQKVPFGGELKVDEFDQGGQYAPNLAWLGGERFVVVWSSANQDGDFEGIFGRLLDMTFAVQDVCGDADENALLTATDALITLRAAVGTSTCLACICDANGSGSVTAADALAVLQAAVRQPVNLLCPPCA